MHHRNATAKLLGRLLEPKFKDNTRIYKGKDIKQSIYTDMNIDISYKQAWRAKNVALEYISDTKAKSVRRLEWMEQSDYTIASWCVLKCVKLKNWSFNGHWFLSKLKECIGEIPNLTIISDRHAAILSSCEAVFPNAFHGYCCRHLMMNCKLKSIKMQCVFWKMCKAYTVEDFGMAINELRSKRPDVYEKLIEAGVELFERMPFQGILQSSDI
ncbi:transposase, MuDR, MULE transposase domain protein [Tanacetum coccineum]|uniref:Transposase, MuDR, MULE transposase domain protein n=1 Tax=Tanacetum coccineum TaxID=301880 RepID=A0ABQ4WYE6_9ASTR